MSSYGAFAAKERPGWFLGLTGPQLIGLGLGAVPAWFSVATGAWASLLLTLPAWLLIGAAVCVPVRGWSAWQWCGVVARHHWGRISGWSTFQSRVAAGDLTVQPAHHTTHRPAYQQARHRIIGSAHHTERQPEHQSQQPERQTVHHLDLDVADLPGALSTLRIHAVPGPGGTTAGLGLVEDRRRQTWAASARLTHPGIGLADQTGRDLMGAGLTALLEAAAASETIEMLALHVRATPETRADRLAWLRDHTTTTSPDLASPDLSVAVHTELEALTAAAAVRHEAYLTVVVSDRRLTRGAGRRRREPAGRAQLMAPLLAEVEGHLLGAMGCTHVRWLSSPDLAAVVRAGFDPADPTATDHNAPGSTGSPVSGSTDSSPGSGRVPWAAAGPTTATASMRCYTHGAWQSVSSTLVLPRNGALMGALARVLVPDRAGERRAVTVLLRPVGRVAALRSTERSGTSAAMAAELRRRVGRDERASDRRAAARVREADEKIERGRALVKVGIVAVATVPVTWDAHDAGRRLDAASRTCGFVAVPLDGAQDSAFAAAALPLGTGLPDQRGRS